MSIGVGVIVIRDRKVLVSRRKLYIREDTWKPSSGAGKLAFPGGHVEDGETLENAAVREVREETGLHVFPYRWDGLRSDLAIQGRMPSLTIFISVVPEYRSGPRNLEPHKHENWIWATLPQLQEMMRETDDWIPLDLLYQYRNELML